MTKRFLVDIKSCEWMSYKVLAPSWNIFVFIILRLFQSVRLVIRKKLNKRRKAYGLWCTEQPKLWNEIGFRCFSAVVMLLTQIYIWLSVTRSLFAPVFNLFLDHVRFVSGIWLMHFEIYYTLWLYTIKSERVMKL